MGLGGNCGPLSRTCNTSGGGGGGGTDGMGGDQLESDVVDGKELLLATNWDLRRWFCWTGGGRAGLLPLLALIIVGLTIFVGSALLIVLLYCESSLLNSNIVGGTEGDALHVGENGSCGPLISHQGSDTVGVVVLEDAVKKSKSSSKPLSTWK